MGGHVDQPVATLVSFGSSKVKIPFFFFFPEAPASTLSSKSLVPKGRVQENLLISSAPVACSKSQSKSAKLETVLLISAVVPAAVILALRGWRNHSSCAEATCSPPGALVPAVLPGGAPGRAVRSDGKCFGLGCVSDTPQV